VLKKQFVKRERERERERESKREREREHERFWFGERASVRRMGIRLHRNALLYLSVMPQLGRAAAP
jgi:hypothetical protein